MFNVNLWGKAELMFDKKMVWLEKTARNLMLLVGGVGLIVIYSGFFYLMFKGNDTSALPWYLLLSPWICIYFGLTQTRQLAVLLWFKQKLTRK
ncbi:hypothetical protein [Shewanella sp. YLB-07]|uniref:hypothetical protein n=1 Tax=Shewanella sp. YLB-07 TaxID=2601268 RepID=UPI00128B1086|nr:hypothetical protein [Shewanella sp. YLB-07]MPY21302.1 hypothetical protein [Shewanella sp. YLB-07]MPY22089.1 hypothetical protein [Shewanella sp. YLB-07]